MITTAEDFQEKRRALQAKIDRHTAAIARINELDAENVKDALQNIPVLYAGRYVPTDGERSRVEFTNFTGAVIAEAVQVDGGGWALKPMANTLYTDMGAIDFVADYVRTLQLSTDKSEKNYHE